MTREQQVRSYWEEVVPQSSKPFGLSDVARFLNKGTREPWISVRTLRRRAASGHLAALGGPGSGLGPYKVRREDLIEYLCSLDTICVPAHRFVEMARGPHQPPTPPAAAPAPRSTFASRPRRRRDADPDQVTLLLPE